MCGDRDSEICVLVEDNEFIESKMNNKFFLASKYAYTLRVVRFYYFDQLLLLSKSKEVFNQS